MPALFCWWVRNVCGKNTRRMIAQVRSVSSTRFHQARSRPGVHRGLFRRVWLPLSWLFTHGCLVHRAVFRSEGSTWRDIQAGSLSRRAVHEAGFKPSSMTGAGLTALPCAQTLYFPMDLALRFSLPWSIALCLACLMMTLETEEHGFPVPRSHLAFSGCLPLWYTCVLQKRSGLRHATFLFVRCLVGERSSARELVRLPSAGEHKHQQDQQDQAGQNQQRYQHPCGLVSRGRELR